MAKHAGTFGFHASAVVNFSPVYGNDQWKEANYCPKRPMLHRSSSVWGQTRHPFSIVCGIEQVLDGNDSGDAKDNSHGEDSKATTSFALKQELIDTLKVLTNKGPEIHKVEQFILDLEALKMTPITPEFTELALAGQWNLLFSSMRTRLSGVVRLRDIVQHVDIEKKQLINEVLWSFPDKSNKEYIDAVLNVSCAYKLVGPGRLEIKLTKHTVTINKRQDGTNSDLPDDMQNILNELRKALPIEYFDPSGLIDVTYIEPDFRIIRFLGKRLAGVRNVFIKKDSENDSR